MAMKRAIVKIEAIIEYDDAIFDLSDIEEASVICFRYEEKYSGEELFLPKWASMEVIDYIETSATNE